MKAAENEQLILWFIGLLEEIGPVDPLELSTAFSEARLQIKQRTEQRDYADPEQCFDRMLQTVARRGFNYEIIEQLARQRQRVLERVSGLAMVAGTGNIPCMPVIPRSSAGYRKLLHAIEIGPEQGFASSELSLVSITDIIEIPAKPYWIYDVDWGASTRDTNPKNAAQQIADRKRSPLTATEALAFCFLTSVLLRHGVIAAGSRWTRNMVPSIILSNTQPLLTAADIHDNSTLLRTPSCIR